MPEPTMPEPAMPDFRDNTPSSSSSSSSSSSRTAFSRLLLSRKGRPAFGIWSSTCSPNVIEAVAYSGIHWIMLDREHAPLDISTCLHALRAIAPSPAVPLVRVAWNDRVLLKHVLDIGAHDLMVPMVESAEQARSAVEFVHFPPLGQRGAASSVRASRYGRDKHYANNCNPFLILQIESTKALANIEAIASVKGVDALFFGPNDLASSMGMLGQASDARVIETIVSAISRVKQAGLYTGVLCPSPSCLTALVRSQADFINITSDMSLVVKGSDQALALAYKSEEEALRLP